MSEQGGWREAVFEDTRQARRGAWVRGTGVWLLAGATFVLLLVDIQHDNDRCGQDCYDGGLRTNEPGHSWTSYEGSWQWEAMFVLGIAAFVAAIGATFAVRHADRSPRAARLMPVLALALTIAWIAWRVLAPAPDA